MRVGPIRLRAEGSVRVGSNIRHRIEQDLNHIKDKTGLDEECLKELIRINDLKIGK